MRFRTWLDVQLLRLLSEDAKDGIYEFLETDLDNRIDWYRDEVDDREIAEESIRQLKHLNRCCCAAGI